MFLICPFLQEHCHKCLVCSTKQLNSPKFYHAYFETVLFRIERQLDSAKSKWSRSLVASKELNTPSRRTWDCSTCFCLQLSIRFSSSCNSLDCWRRNCSLLSHCCCTSCKVNGKCKSYEVEFCLSHRLPTYLLVIPHASTEPRRSANIVQRQRYTKRKSPCVLVESIKL